MLLSLLVSLALAGGGDHIGNGGDAILCPANQTQTYDAYETEQLLGWKIDLGASASYETKVNLVLSRLQLVDPEFSLLLDEYFKDFVRVRQFKNGHLRVINDSFHGPIPLSCTLVQAAVSYFDSNNSWHVILDRNIWKRLDSDNKAALALHEILYRIASKNGSTNSVGVRHINSLLLANKIQDVDFVAERRAANLWLSEERK